MFILEYIHIQRVRVTVVCRPTSSQRDPERITVTDSIQFILVHLVLQQQDDQFLLSCWMIVA